MFAFLLDWLTWVFTAGGVLGFFIIVTLENFVIPIPSEIVLPFAGYLAYTGLYSLTTLIVLSILAAVLGSLLSYALGYYGGLPFIRRYGHWFLLHPKDLDKAHAWFERNGAIAVFICRFIPGVRQISSIPAGAARMPLLSFIFWTALGSALWNGSLIWVGYKLGSQWTQVASYTKYLDIGIVLLALAFAVYWWKRHGKELLAEWRKRKTKTHGANTAQTVQGKAPKPRGKRAQSRRAKKR